MTQSQPEIRTTNRRKTLNKRWSSKAWREKRLTFIKERGGRCEWCGSTQKLTVHHPQRDSYGDEVYMDLYLSGCILLCNRCHAALHAGRVICERDHDDGETHYRWHDAEMCSYCFKKEHPEVIEAAARAKRAKQKRQRELRKKEGQKVKAWKKANPARSGK